MKFVSSDTSLENLSIINLKAVVKGSFSTEGSLRVDGIIKGDVTTGANVVLGTGAEIHGEVKAANITIGGKIFGSVQASGKVILEKNSLLIGDLFANVLVVEEGARFEGKSSMETNEKNS